MWVVAGERVILPHPTPVFCRCYFYLNSSETVKVVTQAFCNSPQHFIWDIRTTFAIPNLPQSPDTGQNSEGGISDFRIFSQSLIKENCHNCKTSYYIDMKLGPVTKFDKKNKTR